MATRSKGSLCAFTIRDEATYGVFDTAGTSEYGGTLETLDTPKETEWVQDADEGHRTFGDAMATANGYGIEATFTHPRQSNWSNWLVRTMGALTGVQNEIGSFSARFNIDSQYAMAVFGAKVDSFSITADKRGSPYKFKVSAKARYLAKPSEGDFDNLGTEVEFLGTDRPAFPPMTYCRPLEVSFDGGTTWVDTKAKNWSLTFDNSLESEADAVIVGDDCYSLESGADSVPNDCKIELSFGILSKSEFWDVKKMDNTKNIQFRVRLDNVVLTMTGCYLTASDLPSRKQSTYDETIGVVVKNVTATIL